MAKIIHKELSYSIRGAFFDVYNALGPMLPEQFYQNALAIDFEAKGIRFQAERLFEVLYRGVQVGRYYTDFWIEEGKILIELKVASEIETIHQAQAISYLKVTDADLAIVANFGAGSFEDIRLPNRLREKTAVFNPIYTHPNIDVPFPDLTNEILTALHRVHFELGSGFLHQVYRRAVMVELQEQEIGYEYIKEWPIFYQDIEIGQQETRLILVEKSILIAAFAVKTTTVAMKAHLRKHLHLQNLKLGILANFYGTKLTINLVRKTKRTNQ